MCRVTVALTCCGDKKDPEFQDLGMDTLGENMYSHIPIFLLPQIVAHWNSPKRNRLIIKSLPFPLLALIKWNKAERREEWAINLSVPCGKRFKERLHESPSVG